MNVTYPMVPEEVTEFCAGKRSVCIVEEGFPDYLEQALNATLRKADLNTTIVGKDVFPKAGEYQAEVMLRGLAGFVEGSVPKGLDLTPVSAAVEVRDGRDARADLELPSGAIEGFVFDTATGLPIAGARIAAAGYPTVYIQEGGYLSDVLSDNLEAFLNGVAQ